MVLVVIARVALIGRLFTNVSVEIHWARDAGQPATRIMAVVLSLMPSDAIYHDLMCLVTHDTPPHEVIEVHAHPMQHVARPACEVVVL